MAVSADGVKDGMLCAPRGCVSGCIDRGGDYCRIINKLFKYLVEEVLVYPSIS